MNVEKTGVRRFNWQLALVLVLAIAVLGGTLYGLRKWRRTYMATHALETGTKAFEARDWPKAAQDLGRYIGAHPKDFATILKYATAQMRMYPQKKGNVDQAVAAYRQILREDPTNPEASDRVAEIYLQIGMPSDAELVTRRRLEAKDDPYARELLAMALAGQRQFKEAAAELAGAIKDYPSRINTYLLLADLVRTRGDDVAGKPIDVLRSAVAANPESAEAHIAVGAFLDQWVGTEKAKAEALKEYATAATLDLSEARVRLRLAERLAAVGDAQGARAQYEAVSKAEPTSVDMWMKWAELERTYGTPEQASAVAKAALEGLGPDSGPFLSRAAELYLYGRNEPEATRCLDKLEKIDPMSPEIAMVRGLIAQAKGDVHEAIKQWRQATTGAEPAQPRVRLALARAYEATGDLQAAVRELRLLVSEHPDFVEAQIQLSKDLSQLGNWWEAGQRAAQALGLAPGNLDARLMELNVRAHLVKNEGARKTLDGLSAEAAALLKQSPGNPRVIILAAQIAQMRGDVATVKALVSSLQADESTRLEGAVLEVGALWQAGRREEAIARMEAAVNQLGARAMAVEQLAYLLVQGGRRDDALKAVTNAAGLATGQEKVSLQIALGRLYANLGDLQKARDILVKVSKENPSDAVSRLMLLGVFKGDDSETAQKVVDEIRKIEGAGSARYRYCQAQVWLSSKDWQSNQANAVSLLSDNIKEDPYDLDSQLLLGMAHEKAGNMRLAIETYRRAYERNPESAPVVFQLIAALQRINDLEGADEVLKEAARRGIAEDKLAGLMLGQQLRQGRMDLAMETAQDMLARDPRNASLQIFIARIKIKQGLFDEAAAMLGKLDAADPNVVMTKVDLLLRQQRPDEALAECDRLVETAKTPLSYLIRARARALAGKLDAAEEDYREIARIAPEKAQSWVTLSDYLLARNKTDEALKAAEKALGVEKDLPAAAIRAARLCDMLGDADSRKKGREILDSAIAAHPGDVDLALYKVRTLMATNREDSLQQARKTLDEITRQNGDRIDAWELMAQTSLQQGMVDGALEAVARAMAADPDGRERRPLLLLKAQAEKMRWPALAAATLKSLWDSNREDIPVGLYLAQAYRAGGDSDKALALLKEMRGAAKGADAVNVELALVDAMDAAGDHAGAAARAMELRAAAPDDPRPVVLLSVVLSRMEKWGEASNTLAQWQDAHPNDASAVLTAAEALVAEARTYASQSGARSQDKAAVCRQSAVGLLEYAVAKHPNNVDARIALGVACQMTGNIDKAEETYRRILDEHGDRAVVLNNLAWVLCENRNKPKEALAIADRGRKAYPEMAAIADTRGVIYERLGRFDDARREYEECLKATPRTSEAGVAARFHLGRALAAMDRKAEAISAIRDVLDTSAGMLSPSDKAEADALLSSLVAQMTMPSK